VTKQQNHLEKVAKEYLKARDIVAEYILERFHLKPASRDAKQSAGMDAAAIIARLAKAGMLLITEEDHP